MLAMLLDSPDAPLRAAEVPDPVPAEGEVLLRTRACGVCRTDLHVRDGELVPQRGYPVVLGHQIVGERVGDGSHPPQRVGVPWLGWTDGTCAFCRAGRENLCEHARFTGFDVDGGFAELVVADERFCLPLPDGFADLDAAPLLCAGLIGFRALRMCGSAQALGLYGFGAAAHIIAQVAAWQGRTVHAFTRPGDVASQDFARELGCASAQGTDEAPPEPLEAAIIFAPAGELVPLALRALAPGGVVVCAGIHMSDIPSFPYADLWHERSIRSVANLTREDGHAFLEIAPRVRVRTHVTTYALRDAERALDDLRSGALQGAAVLVA